ncbi:MAG: DNA double-strand break repair nuclease NurA [bacterium]
MLDRAKLAKQITYLAEKIFPDFFQSSDIAQKKWQQICNDQYFLQKVEAAQSSFLLPGWQGNLSDTFQIKNDLTNYSVLAVDGSQIYPDRNFSGASCFLINSGGCFLKYGQKSEAKFFNEPKLFLPDDLKDERFAFSRDLVDLIREELEFKTLFEKFSFYKKEYNLKNDGFVCLMDGTIIFWTLEGKLPEVKQYFLDRYLYYLNQFYKNNILIASFISFPKSKELVNLIKIGLCRFDLVDCIKCHKEFTDFPCKVVDNLIDTKIVRMFFPFDKKNKYYRTTLFYSNSKIVQNYPDQLKPCFFYLDVGAEIVRIEVPVYVALDQEKLDLICKVAMDQSLKGNGYPVCLAESHAQAVVKNADREFFYHLIYKLGIEQNRRFFMSQKSIKKRGIGI